jgi:hypothetical protein
MPSTNPQIINEKNRQDADLALGVREGKKFPGGKELP